MILQVGLDESGYGQTGADEAFVFAGYVGPVTHIEAFTHVWDDILKREPALSAKKLKKLVRSRHSPDPRVKLLVETVRACHLHGVRFKIVQDDHSAMMKMIAPLTVNNPRARLISSNPYFFAFMGLLLRLIGEIWNDPDAKIEVIYDENIQERPKLEQGYALFRTFAEKFGPKFLGKLAKDPVPRNDEEFFLLRAADALAWHSHKAHVQTCHGRDYENEIWEALNSVPFFVDEHWKIDDLREVVESMIRSRLRRDP
ncbi:MAG TPA: hypothetical protein VMV15_10515 [Candidatus Binataceae bacterium]|nr:hypothetical protein [Candidatus Binataceae bacterium]